MTDNKKNTFWDVDSSKLDFIAHKSFIIPRVMDQGSYEEVREIMSFYGRDAVLEVLMAAPYLEKKTLSFCEAFFGIPRSSFRSYNRRQIWQIWK